MLAFLKERPMKIAIKVLSALMILFFVSPFSFASDKKDLRIKVLAGNGDLNSAEKIADHLKSLGYAINPVDHALRSDFSSTMIFFAKTFVDSAQTLALDLNLENSAVKPLSWPSPFDLIVVTGMNDKPEASPSAGMEKESPKTQKMLSQENEQLSKTRETLVLNLDEAHDLFVKGQYDLAQQKYEFTKKLLPGALDDCETAALSQNAETLTIPVIQILSRDKDLGSARKMAEILAQKGYVVSTVDYAYRSDLVEKAIFYKPALKNQASEIASTTGQSLSLLPLQWQSQYDVIIVSSRPVSEDLEIKDIHQKLLELHEEEKQTRDTITILINEAFDLQKKGACSAAHHKFGEIKTFVSLVESICETSQRLAPEKATEIVYSSNEESDLKLAGNPSTVLNLDEALKIALLNNTTLKEAQEKLNAAYEGKKSARADFLPKANFGYAYTRLNEAPSISFPDEVSFSINGNPVTIALPGGGLAMGSEDIYTWNLTLSQPLFTGFGLLSQYEISKLNVEITAVQKETLVLNLVSDVKKAYLNSLLIEKVHQVTQETVENLKSHEADAQQFYNQGMVPYNDLLKAKVALANAVQENERTGAILKNTLASLNVLLNYDVNRNVTLEDIFILSPVPYQLSDLLHEAIENRPELYLVKLAIKQMDQVIRGVKSAYYPQVALVGRYEQTGQDTLATDNDFGDVESSSILLQANMSLFKGGKTKYDISKYSFEKKALLNQYDGAEKNVQLEVKNFYENLQVSEKNIKTAQESLAQAKENWRITNLQYKEQIATSTDVLDSRTYLSEAQLNYYRALYGYMIWVSDLERAVARPYSPFDE
jgi:outer membrane protein